MLCCCTTGELVRLIDQLEIDYGDIKDLPTFLRTGKAPNIKEFIAADGMSAIVHVAVTGWPADGNLTASKHPYDRVTDVGAAAVQHEAHFLAPVKTLKQGKHRWRSPRRRAIMALAGLGHYG
jgi:hypothetical protein